LPGDFTAVLQQIVPKTRNRRRAWTAAWIERTLPPNGAER